MRRALRAELLKLVSVRSSIWALTSTPLIAAGLGFVVASAFRSSDAVNLDPVFASFYGITLSQFGVVTLGVLCIGQEHALGTIRRSLLAIPRRRTIYTSKILAIAIVVAPVSVVTAVASHRVAQTTLGNRGIGFLAEDSPRAIIGASLYLLLICLFAFGVAAMLRSSTGALVLLLPVLLLGSQGFGNLPAIRSYAQYLPDQAGNLIIHMAGPPDAPVFDRAYGPWVGVGILAVWAVVALAIGYQITKRDV